MRTHRKRKWSPLTVNMIPLINVIFLINIFIVMMINFSEVLIKRVTLPKADEAKQSTEQLIKKILVTVKSKDVLFLGRTRVTLDDLEYAIRKMVPYPQGSTVQLRGEENVFRKESARHCADCVHDLRARFLGVGPRYGRYERDKRSGGQQPQESEPCFRFSRVGHRGHALLVASGHDAGHDAGIGILQHNSRRCTK